MKLHKYSQWKFGVVLGIGVLVALVLCVQCVRTYWYADAVLVPRQAEHEAARQAGALSAAARSAGINNPLELGPVMERTIESASDRVLWMRILDVDSNVLAQRGVPQGTPRIPKGWWERAEKQESLGASVDTPEGKALLVMLPLRMPRPPYPGPADSNPHRSSLDRHIDHRHTGYILELAISLKAVAGAFDGLRQHLIVGLIASIALLISVGVIGLRAPHYLRGKYLESELQLARRVQSDLQPKPHSVSAHVEFAASAVAADHVGGDFYDIFEAESGKISIVLGDASGKGVPAALLVSVLQGAIRSSTASLHEFACERVNHMLCERSACERFATLFWAVFDPVTRTLRYVNAGHAAPMLIRQNQHKIERLDQGGPVLGLLPNARYSAGLVKLEHSDTLVIYSDGITETTDHVEEEFGEARIQQTILDNAEASPEQLCAHIMNSVNVFASADSARDDRTLLVVKLPQSEAALSQGRSVDVGIRAVA